MIHDRGPRRLWRFRLLPAWLPFLALTVFGRDTVVSKNSNQTSSVTEEPANARSFYQRGLAMEEGSNGLQKDEGQAAEWYLRAAEKNYAPAQYNLALLYEEGRGVPQNFSEAARWYRAAAEQGDADAQNNLGRLCAFGSGMAKDLTQAVYWYAKSADQGNAMGLNNLANCYREGRGVKPDAHKALALYERAALMGYPAAQNNLGLLYANAGAAEPDNCRAYAWLSLAAKGWPAAEATLQQLRRKMSDSEIGSAEDIRDELEAKVAAAAKESVHQ